MGKNRIVIYLPDEHLITKLPVKERAKTAKKLIEFALLYQEKMDQLQADIQDIKNTLAGGMVPSVPEKSKEMIDADTELIKDLLGMS